MVSTAQAAGLPGNWRDGEAVTQAFGDRAETQEAGRVGAIAHGEIAAVTTPAQLDSIPMAGERALAMKVAPH